VKRKKVYSEMCKTHLTIFFLKFTFIAILQKQADLRNIHGLPHQSLIIIQSYTIRYYTKFKYIKITFIALTFSFKKGALTLKIINIDIINTAGVGH
jgi:hypothetical protein